MIDLRKPLEGAPGLLLLAALILFGAAIGVSLALACSWVEMKESLANFLGGVVGAGLGAALAVRGAVYVQRAESRERLRTTTNEVRQGIADLVQFVGVLRLFIEFRFPTTNTAEEQANWLKVYVSQGEHVAALLPNGADLPQAAHQSMVKLKRAIPPMLQATRKYLDAVGAGTETERLRANAIREFKQIAYLVSAVAHHLEKL